jgi:TetR/AcrR family transcriptional repressor of nem operon
VKTGFFSGKLIPFSRPLEFSRLREFKLRMARTKVFNEKDVLDKAVKLFWEKGYNGTSAQDLVDGLGISRSSLYDTFGDKYQLFKLSLMQYRQEFSGTMIKLIESSTDYERTIADIFSYLVKDTFLEKCSNGCFMVNSTIELAPHNEEIAKIIFENNQDIENALSNLIEKGQDEGIFSKKHSSRALARFLFNTVSGLRVASKSGSKKQVFDDIVRVTLSALK